MTTYIPQEDVDEYMRRYHKAREEGLLTEFRKENIDIIKETSNGHQLFIEIDPYQTYFDTMWDVQEIRFTIYHFFNGKLHKKFVNVAFTREMMDDIEINFISRHIDMISRAIDDSILIEEKDFVGSSILNFI